MCLYAYREGSLAESLLHSLVLELRRFPIFHRRNSRLSLEKPRTPPPSNGRGARPTNRPTSSSSSSSNHPGSEYRHIWTKSNVSYLNVSTYLPTYPPPPGARSSAGRSRICRPFFFFSFFFPPQQARPSPPRVPGTGFLLDFLFSLFLQGRGREIELIFRDLLARLLAGEAGRENIFLIDDRHDCEKRKEKKASIEDVLNISAALTILELFSPM